jgi:galactokinase
MDHYKVHSNAKCILGAGGDGIMNIRTLQDVFKREFSRSGEVIVQAPGRVNILGEHTDYNEGFVFPCAIDRYISIVAAVRDDSIVNAYSVDFEQRIEFDQGRFEFSPDVQWSNYVRGVVSEYQKKSYQLPGVDLVISGNVPLGAGLSSSAAFEVAVAETFRVLGDLEIEKVDLALLSQAAENKYVGVQCGIMDQFASVLSKAGSALFLDCRDLSYSLVPLNPDTSVVVCDSRVQRSLDNSEYNKRRLECEDAARILGEWHEDVEALRDVPVSALREVKPLLSEDYFKRVKHVVFENDRVQKGIELLEDGDVEAFGSLLYESHESLRDEFVVSCRELDLLVELARTAPGTFGARMTGAGFGGCTVNLVQTTEVDQFSNTIAAGYLEKTGIAPSVYVCQPSDGVTAARM